MARRWWFDEPRWGWRHYVAILLCVVVFWTAFAFLFPEFDGRDVHLPRVHQLPLRIR